jgi:hypothetical protein
MYHHPFSYLERRGQPRTANVVVAYSLTLMPTARYHAQVKAPGRASRSPCFESLAWNCSALPAPYLQYQSSRLSVALRPCFNIATGVNLESSVVSEPNVIGTGNVIIR